MAFTLPLTFEWMKHRNLAICRIISKRSPLYFIIKNENLKPVKNKDGSYVLCPVCGYSMAQLSMPYDWTVTACSASSFKNIMHNQAVEDWLKEVNDQKVTNVLESKHLSIK